MQVRKVLSKGPNHTNDRCAYGSKLQATGQKGFMIKVRKRAETFSLIIYFDRNPKVMPKAKTSFQLLCIQMCILLKLGTLFKFQPHYLLLIA